MGLFSSLGHRRFALLWTGQTFSRVGDHLYQIALAWWVLQKTGSATAMGAVLICSFAPMLVFLLIGGVAVDRLPRVRLMLGSDLGRGLLMTGVAALAYAGRLQVWEIYAASVLFGLVDAVFQPAYAAAVPELTPAEALPSANSLTSLSTQAGRVVGPAIGAAVIAAGGTPLAFAVNAASFFIAAAFVVPLLGSDRRPAAPSSSSEPAAPRSSVFHDLKEGIAVVTKAPWLWITIGFFAIANVTLSGPYGVSLPFLVRTRGDGVRTLGLLYAMFPLGYALSAVLLGRVKMIRHRGRILYGGMVTAGIALAMFGLPAPAVVWAVAAVVNGAALEVAGLVWTNALQERVEPRLLGRVASIDSLGSYALLPVGYAVAGWATDRIGAPMVFLIGGSLTAALGIAALLHPVVRNWDGAGQHVAQPVIAGTS